jgi:hypothetical protein
MIERLRYWYESDSRPAHRFRYGLLAFDIVTVVFVVASSFTRDAWWVEALDVVFGLLILADFTARLLISRHRLRDLLHPTTWADAFAILSFLAPLAGEAGGFLRVLRTLRLLQTYQLLSRLRADSPWFRRNEELALAVVHLVVFLFVMTGLVYETQHWTPADRQLCRCALFHCDGPYNDRFWRHHAAGHYRPPDLCRHHDLWRDPVSASASLPAAVAKGPLSLPRLRLAASRGRRCPLQGVRTGVEHS